MTDEEQDKEKEDATEEQEMKATQELLEEQYEDWGSRKLQEREQEDRIMRSQIPKIKGRSQGGKREQDQEKGGRCKKLKYRREEEDWGDIQLPFTDIREQNDHTSLEKLPPLEQRSNPRRSRQRSIRELLVPPSAAPEGSPPEPLGSILESDLKNEEISVVELHEEQLDTQMMNKEVEVQDKMTKRTQEDVLEISLASNNEKNDLSTTPSCAYREEKANEKVVEDERKVVFTPPEQVEMMEKDDVEDTISKEDKKVNKEDKNIREVYPNEENIEIPVGGEGVLTRLEGPTVGATNGDDEQSTSVENDVKEDNDDVFEDNVLMGVVHKCDIMRGGWCRTHQLMGKKLKVSAQKWRKDKTGVFKYMRTQTTKYICPGQSTTNRVTRNSTEVNIGQRLGDSGDNFPGPSLAILGVDNDLKGSVGCLKEKV